jgi:hypothetical protein
MLDALLKLINALGQFLLLLAGIVDSADGFFVCKKSFIEEGVKAKAFFCSK